MAEEKKLLEIQNLLKIFSDKWCKGTGGTGRTGCFTFYQ